MNSTTKSLAPWLCVAGLGAGIYFQYAQGRARESELSQLRQEAQEFPQVRAENEELKKLKAQGDELVRLRKDNEEVYRLRNEVGQLRKDKDQFAKQMQQAQSQQPRLDPQQLQQLQAENQQLRTMNQQFQVANAQTQVNTCINNLRIIDAAKEQWALESKKTRGTIVAQDHITPYMKGNALPVCPAGGIYSLFTVGAPATCTIPGHALPPR